MNNDHYVYLHKRKDNGIVFYIGHGRLNRAETQRKRSESWVEVVKSARGFDIEYLHMGLSKQEATQIENNYLSKPRKDWQLVNIAPPRTVNEIDITLIKQYLLYDVSSPSFLRWKKPLAANTKKDLVAGYLDPKKGYLSVRLRGKLYPAHRLVWALHNECIPTDLVINHIDNNRSNNDLSLIHI